MIGQKTLLSFFSAAQAKKRSRSPEPLGAAEAGSPKRPKAGAPQSPPLSPEQLERIRRNKEAALQRLASRLGSLAPPEIAQDWRAALAGEFARPYFAQLMDFVAAERKRYTVYPAVHQVFTWTQMCGIRDVKAVILGQDPYHGPNQAHGLCFSVQRPVPPPPSLENIYKELAEDIEGFSHPGHGDLTGWAKQGGSVVLPAEECSKMESDMDACIKQHYFRNDPCIYSTLQNRVLLLNAVLTVRAHQANSHKEKGWEQFTDAVVSWLNNNLDGVVFMLWGAYAQKKGSSIDRKRHHVLQTAHPSPLSVHRGFFGCKHFSKTNELLKKSGKKPIDWSSL